MATPLPPTSDLVTTGISKGVFKAALTSLRAYLAGLLGTTGEPIDARKALGTGWNSSVSKTGAYTIVADDRGKVIKCSGSFTLSITDAATLGDGFFACARNVGTGSIVLDPALTQKIDGADTLTLAPGKSLICYSDGSEIHTFGRGGVESVGGNVGAITAAQVLAAVVSALGYTPAPAGVAKDNGALNVGSFVLAYNASSSLVASGGTIAGSSLIYTSIGGGGAMTAGGALSGTWRNVSAAAAIQTSQTINLWQRIA